MNSQIASSIVQAVAALIQACVAVALFVITKRYVDLTARLALASEAQVEIMRAEREQFRIDRESHQASTLDRFRQESTNLWERLRQLPGNNAEARHAADRLFRTALLPTDDGIESFVALGSAIGPAVGQGARAAADSLLHLLKIARAVQNTKPEIGYDYNQVNWKLWDFRYAEVENALRKFAVP